MGLSVLVLHCVLVFFFKDILLLIKSIFFLRGPSLCETISLHTYSVKPRSFEIYRVKAHTLEILKPKIPFIYSLDTKEDIGNITNLWADPILLKTEAVKSVDFEV